MKAECRKSGVQPLFRHSEGCSFILSSLLLLPDGSVLVESFFKSLAGLEGSSLALGDLDLGAGHGVVALMGGTGAGLEYAKADKLNLFTLLEGLVRPLFSATAAISSVLFIDYILLIIIGSNFAQGVLYQLFPLSTSLILIFCSK